MFPGSPHREGGPVPWPEVTSNHAGPRDLLREPGFGRERQTGEGISGPAGKGARMTRRAKQK